MALLLCLASSQASRKVIFSMTAQQRSALDHLFDALLFDCSQRLFKALYPSNDRKVWEPVHIVICDGDKALKPIGGVFDRRDSELPGLVKQHETFLPLAAI